jgi:hypothetical protein
MSHSNAQVTEVGDCAEDAVRAVSCRAAMATDGYPLTLDAHKGRGAFKRATTRRQPLIGRLCGVSQLLKRYTVARSAAQAGTTAAQTTGIAGGKLGATNATVDGGCGVCPALGRAVELCTGHIAGRLICRDLLDERDPD